MTYYFRALIPCLIALLLTACSIQDMAEKIIPEDVRTDANLQIDAISNNDLSLLVESLGINIENEAIEKQLDGVRSQIIDGPEIRRDIVGAHAKTHFSASMAEGKQSETTYNVTYEIEKEKGFMAITTHYTLKENGECCRLYHVNVQKFDSSPYRLGFAALKKAVFIAGGILLFILFGLIVFFVRRTRRKKRPTQVVP